MPFIIAWPGTIQSGISRALVTHTDFIASFSALLDVELPEGAAPDSQNCTAAILGNNPVGNACIIEEAGGYALRTGDWKLIRQSEAPSSGAKRSAAQAQNRTQYELYNLAQHIGEQHNVPLRYPEKASVLTDLLEQISQDARPRNTFESLQGNRSGDDRP